MMANACADRVVVPRPILGGPFNVASKGDRRVIAILRAALKLAPRGQRLVRVALSCASA